MNDSEIISISKFLSLVLRHKPETIGLQLDANGWADVAELIKKAGARNISLDFDVLKYVVNNNDKKRFAFGTDYTKIRASQGHSVAVDLEYKPTTPPHILYHGTARQNVESIQANGLVKKQRQHVHLSTTVQTAVTVGSRHGSPVVFIVKAQQMHNDGFEFFLSDNNVWLTDFVPAKYLTLSDYNKKMV